ncbi:MAG: hypothetical protein KME42_21100 [Tildeniella nuda ZEHNDER 1965/U140]|jgi:hypothetical protein|nr:hypothetical protein [Tildeniella nuda ZEHNDER 1965/U140]
MISYKIFGNLLVFNISTIAIFCTAGNPALSRSLPIVSEKSVPESFSTEASDLLGSPVLKNPENTERIKENLGGIREALKKLLGKPGYFEIGEHSCYVNFGDRSQIYVSDMPTETFTLTTSTPTRKGQTVTLESRETQFSELRKTCYNSINILIERDKLLLKLDTYTYEPKKYRELELNVEDSWNLLIRKD